MERNYLQATRVLSALSLLRNPHSRDVVRTQVLTGDPCTMQEMFEKLPMSRLVMYLVRGSLCIKCSTQYFLDSHKEIASRT